jgi:nitrite reductase/ring-hydroxylating ferredoxin subunit
MLMAEQFVCKSSEFKDGDRRIVRVGSHEIGVFNHNGEIYAYSNYCLHQGGPACEGLTIAKVEERLNPDMTSKGLFFSETEMNFVCPWHGMEFDIKTGRCIADGRQRLKPYKVVRKGEDLYVSV